MASIEIQVPDIGDFDEVTVIELMVKPGDTVKVDQSLLTVESDKASMEIPSSHAGVVKALQVKLGDKVKQGSVVLTLEAEAAGTSAPAAASTPAPAPSVPSAPEVAATVVASSEVKAAVAPVVAAQAAPFSIANAAIVVAAPAHNPTSNPVGLPHASPSVRKFARELGVPLNEVKGSGLKGRITEADVQAFTRSVMSGAAQTAAGAAANKGGAGDGAALGLIPWPKVDFAKFGPVERKELGRIKKISGANLLRNAIMIPAVTNHDDADITDLEAFRVATNLETAKSGKPGAESGVKVTMLAFLI